jgi:hypothetical protein
VGTRSGVEKDSTVRRATVLVGVTNVGDDAANEMVLVGVKEAEVFNSSALPPTAVGCWLGDSLWDR